MSMPIIVEAFYNFVSNQAKETKSKVEDLNNIVFLRHYFTVSKSGNLFLDEKTAEKFLNSAREYNNLVHVFSSTIKTLQNNGYLKSAPVSDDVEAHFIILLGGQKDIKEFQTKSIEELL